jgi:hypothetical protein
MYRRGFGQVDTSMLPLTGPVTSSPSDIAALLASGNLNNPLSATGQSALSPTVLNALSTANASTFTTSLSDWIGENAGLVTIAAVGMFLLLILPGSSRRRR